MGSWWRARGEGVLEGKMAQPQSWREPQHDDQWGEQQQWQRLREVRNRVVDGTTDMERGGGAEDFVRVHPRVDRLDAHEGDGHEADEYTEHDTMPTREHQPQEHLAMYAIEGHRSGPSTILCHSGVEAGGEYRGKSLRSQRLLS
jgi:hypothetical protein